MIKILLICAGLRQKNVGQNISIWQFSQYGDKKFNGAIFKIMVCDSSTGIKLVQICRPHELKVGGSNLYPVLSLIYFVSFS